MEQDTPQLAKPILEYASPIHSLKHDAFTWIGAVLAFLLLCSAIFFTAIAMLAGLGGLLLPAIFFSGIGMLVCGFLTMWRRSFISAVLVSCWLAWMLIYWASEFISMGDWHSAGVVGFFLFFEIPGLIALVSHIRWAIRLRRHARIR